MRFLLLLSVVSSTVNQYYWDSVAPGTTFGTNNKLLYNGPGNVIFQLQTDGSYGITYNGFINEPFKREPGVGSTTPHYTFTLDSDGHFTLVKSEDQGDTPIDLANAQGPTNSPFKIFVGGDRRVRMIDARQSTIWTYPRDDVVVTRDRIESNMASRPNFLRNNERLTSSNKNWYLSMNSVGMLYTNTGYTFNPSNGDGIDVDYRSIVLNEDATLSYHLIDGTVIPVTDENDGSRSPPSTPSQISKYRMFITDEGIIRIQDIRGVVLWNFNIASTGQPVGLSYWPIILAKTGQCITAMSDKSISLQACSVTSENQYFTYHSDYLRVKSDPTKCITISDGNKLVIDKCSTKSLFNNVEQDFTIRTLDRKKCFHAANIVELLPCDLTDNDELFTWDMKYVPLKDTDFEAIFTMNLDYRIGSSEDEIELKPYNNKQTGKWAFKDGKLRWNISPNYCMDDGGNTVVLKDCSTASTWTKLITGQIQSTKSTNCITYDYKTLTLSLEYCNTNNNMQRLYFSRTDSIDDVVKNEPAKNIILISEATGLCLSTSDNNIRQEKCNSANNQLWNYRLDGKIMSVGSKKCVNNIDINHIGMGDCNSERTTIFKNIGKENYMFETKDNMCLDIGGLDPSMTWLYSCMSTNGNQLFTSNIIYSSIDYGVIQLTNQDKVIKLNEDKSIVLSDKKIWEPSQQFYLTAENKLKNSNNGCISYKNAEDGVKLFLDYCYLAKKFVFSNDRLQSLTDHQFCIDNSGGELGNGNPLQIWYCITGQPNQLWKMVRS
ncbi:hypothetical protein HK099_000285 [Clydaea vesicula]|uniref:Ricin B lectin domain-containing protein n=1 Tax=Clydaea vesicula TaxID=447962 RepID=A0AAD5U7J0_9FUNG|nr:hypothetical protein HK099_000285 [Clydaea vesicula]